MRGLFYFIACYLITSNLCAQHSVERLSFPLNTEKYDEICPIFNFDENNLFYTRVGSPSFERTLLFYGEDLHTTLKPEQYQKKLNLIYGLIKGGQIEDAVSSEFNQDIWMARMLEDGGMEVSHPGYPLNNALPNSICSSYGKDSAYVVINQFGINGGLDEGFSVVNMDDNGIFSFPRPIMIRGFEKVGASINLTMTLDKQHIFLAMKGAGCKGGRDIFHSIKVNDSLYAKPVCIGGVNGPYDETTPFISQDRSKLYFASNRPGGQGGFDIYVSDRLDLSYTNWSEPRRLGNILNSKANESQPYVFRDEDQIYFTSDRDGSSDIFRAKLKRDSVLNSNILLRINVIKEETNENHISELMWGPAYEEHDWPGYRRLRLGFYEFTIDSLDNTPLIFKAQNRGYISKDQIIDPQELMLKGITELDITLVLKKDGSVARRPIAKLDKEKKDREKRVMEEAPEKESIIPFDAEVNRTIVLSNIYFYRGKSSVIPTSYPTLQKLASTLIEREGLRIRIEGHTDNVGDIEALYQLSEARAKAIRDFLLDQGVPYSKVEIKGFGPVNPITDNKTERERMLNRRVEIRVLENN